MSGERMVVMSEEQRDWWASYAEAFREEIRVDCLDEAESAAWTDTAERIDALVAAFEAASPAASDPRFAQIRDLLAVWVGEGSKIGAAYAIASAAAAGERGDDG